MSAGQQDPLTRLGREQAMQGVSPLHAVGGRDALLDSGLPLVVFVTVYTAAGRALAPALWAALGTGAVLAGLRLVRREPTKNVIAGFLGLAIAAFFASRTGRAEDIFLPGLVINAAYALAYLVSLLVRWPLLGVFVGLVTGAGMAWRRDPLLLRAFSVASWFWVALFVLRLVVQVPLYLARDEGLVWLTVARLAMGWPMFFLCIWLSWLVVRRAYAERDRIDAASSAARRAGE